ncbi:MAG: class II fructose-bisphosphate aldolase [Bacteroidota bacterium]
MARAGMVSLLRTAAEHGYAVGAFNMHCLEGGQAIVRGAEAEQAPVILQINEATLHYAGLACLAALAGYLRDEAKVPVALHLDHGVSFETAVACIRHGFDSVMIDGSRLPFAENVALTRRVVDVAHACGVAVEAELGRVGGTEDDLTVLEREATFTDPAAAREFVAQTAVDCLAVAIGTAHGLYKGECKLDLDRLTRIREQVDVPLVLHGGTGVPDDLLQAATTRGIAKVNISTELRLALAGALERQFKAEPGASDLRKLLGEARRCAEEMVRDRIRAFGSSGRAA